MKIEGFVKGKMKQLKLAQKIAILLTILRLCPDNLLDMKLKKELTYSCMKKGVKIFLIWAVVTLVMALLVFTQAESHIAIAAFLMTSIELLIGIISVF